MTLKVSFAAGDHGRVAALHDDGVGAPGMQIESHVLPTTKLFPIAVQEARFEITELSVSGYAVRTSRRVGVSLDRALESLGLDYWPDGFAANRAELTAICRYCRARRPPARDVTPEEMVHSSVLET